MSAVIFLRVYLTAASPSGTFKSFVMDDERMKQGENVFGKDYFFEKIEMLY